ncbi:Hypothetical predicted protein, partial [Mytilus galloprovincialis]
KYHKSNLMHTVLHHLQQYCIDIRSQNVFKFKKISGLSGTYVIDKSKGLWNTNLYGELERFHVLYLPYTVLPLKVKTYRSQYDKMTKLMELLIKNDIHIVIGPFDDSIAVVTEKLEIPYLALTSNQHGRRLRSTFQLLPTLSDFSSAMLDLISYYKWDKVSLFYDDDRGVDMLEKLLSNHDLMVKSWRVDSVGTDEQIRDHLVHMRIAFVQTSIIFCNRNNTYQILEQARSLAMMSIPYEWFFYDPGDQLVHIFKGFEDITFNYTVFSLMEFNSHVYGVKHPEEKLNVALTTDALYIINQTVPRLDNNTVQGIRKDMINILKQSLFGDNEEVNVYTTEDTTMPEYRKKDLMFETLKIGRWVSYQDGMFIPRLQMTENIERGNKTTQFPLRGRKARIVMIEEKPFTMHKKDHEKYSGNERFEGYSVDLITEIANMLHFEFEIYLVHDGKFGTKEKNGEWNGMLGELLKGNATMSVAPLSINSLREEAVDFTKPFMTRYISVLMKVPMSERSYFEFLNPLHPLVWFCTFGAFVVVSLVLYMFEKVGASHSKDLPGISFKESFWFVFGSLLQGSTEASPSTLPGRILTSAWWFFALILISSYTANLAAFLTVKKINTPIKSVTDLASQTTIRYGTVVDSGIMQFFKNTDIEHFAKMWAQMSEIDPQESMVANTSVGFNKVKKGNYAFFWDTAVNKYMTIKDCEFMEIGPHFDPKGFGIGVPPGATYREELSMAILKLGDASILHQLENKWWPRRTCPDVTKPSAEETSELQIENVAGVFFILSGGIVCAAIACVFEYFSKRCKNREREVQKRKENNSTPNHVNHKERESFL